MTPVIPAPVPVPLPAPLWLLQILLVVTFILHLLPMNLLVGGGALVALSSFLGRRDERHRELARRAAQALPPVVAFTITLGVAPLLFLQLVYGQLFYTSSVLMAWVWLATVLLIMLGYYGVYWFNLQHQELGTRAPWVMLVTAIVFIHVAAIFTHNMTFMLRPDEFFRRYLETGVGLSLGPFDGVYFARLSHFLVASVAVAGLGLAHLARAFWRDNPELHEWAQRYGTRWFMVGTGVQFMVGVWFLLSLPGHIRHLFLGEDKLATAVLATAILLAVVALMAAPRSLAASTTAIIGTIGLMAVVRHLVRVAYLRPYFDPRNLPVESQWPVFVVFVLLLLAGLLTVGWMLHALFGPAAHAPSE